MSIKSILKDKNNCKDNIHRVGRKIERKQGSQEETTKVPTCL